MYFPVCISYIMHVFSWDWCLFYAKFGSICCIGHGKVIKSTRMCFGSNLGKKSTFRGACMRPERRPHDMSRNPYDPFTAAWRPMPRPGACATPWAHMTPIQPLQISFPALFGPMWPPCSRMSARILGSYKRMKLGLEKGSLAAIRFHTRSLPNLIGRRFFWARIEGRRRISSRGASRISMAWIRRAFIIIP